MGHRVVSALPKGNVFTKIKSNCQREKQLPRAQKRDVMLHARSSEKRMIEACERRILEFPVGMDAREVAKELKREGWYAWAPKTTDENDSDEILTQGK